MDVRGATNVVAGEDGLELHNAIFVAGLDATKECCVEVGGIGLVAVAVGLDTGVHALEQLIVSYCIAIHVGLLRVIPLHCSARCPCRRLAVGCKCWCRLLGCPCTEGLRAGIPRRSRESVRRSRLQLMSWI